MEEMIKRIIDMDKKAREITDSAQEEKLHSEQEIAQRAAQLREDYLDRARRRIQINAETEKALAEQRWERRKQKYAQQKADLERTYEVKHQEWVDQIVKNILEG